MTTKVCYDCRSEVDGLARVCPCCRAKLGNRGADGMACKRAGLLKGCSTGCLWYFGIIIALGLLAGIVKFFSEK